MIKAGVLIQLTSPPPMMVLPGLKDTITITITVMGVNEAPVFAEGATATRSVPEDAAVGKDIIRYVFRYRF